MNSPSSPSLQSSSQLQSGTVTAVAAGMDAPTAKKLSPPLECQQPPPPPQQLQQQQQQPLAIPDELTCPICQDLLDKAVRIKSCGHFFCSLCIRTAFSAQKHTGSKHHRALCACPACLTLGLGRDGADHESTMIKNFETSLEPATTIQQQVDQFLSQLQRQQEQHEQQQQQQREEEHQLQERSFKDTASTTVTETSSSFSPWEIRRSTRIKTNNQKISVQENNDNNADAVNNCDLDDDNDDDFDYQEDGHQSKLRKKSSSCLKPPAVAVSVAATSSALAPLSSHHLHSSSQRKHFIATHNVPATTEEPISKKYPKTFYTKMKKKDLQQLCRNDGLSDSGTETDLTERHRRFVTMWNAELDCQNIQLRKRPSELRREFLQQERNTNQSNQTKSRFKLFGRDGHEIKDLEGYSEVRFANPEHQQEFDSKFKELIEELEKRTPTERKEYRKQSRIRNKWWDWDETEDNDNRQPQHPPEQQKKPYNNNNNRINDITNQMDHPPAGQSLVTSQDEGSTVTMEMATEAKNNNPPPHQQQHVASNDAAATAAAHRQRSSMIIKNPYLATTPSRNFRSSGVGTTTTMVSSSTLAPAQRRNIAIKNPYLATAPNRNRTSSAAGVMTSAVDSSSTKPMPSLAAQNHYYARTQAQQKASPSPSNSFSNLESRPSSSSYSTTQTMPGLSHGQRQGLKKRQSPTTAHYSSFESNINSGQPSNVSPPSSAAFFLSSSSSSIKKSRTTPPTKTAAVTTTKTTTKKRGGLWSCTVCTYAGNPSCISKCEVCDSKRGVVIDLT